MATSLKNVIKMVSEENKKKYPRKETKDYKEKYRVEYKDVWKRTSATVWHEDIQTFKELANIKFKEDPMNSAWQEAVELWIKENSEWYNKKAEEVKKKYK